MGLLKTVLNWKADPTEEISKTFDIAECGPEDCEGCDAKFPPSVSIDTSLPLWDNTPKWDLHIISATGKTDWKHDVADEKHSVMNALNAHGSKLSKLEKLAGGKLKLNASSIAVPHEFYEATDENKAQSSVLLLPFFLNVEVTPETAIDDVLQVTQLYMDQEKRKSLTDYKLLSGHKVTASNNLGYVLLCSHRTRDKRCGVTAPIMKKQFESVLREHDLYRDASDDRPGGVQVHYISHVGGHKFSANVIIYLRTGEVIWMARCTPEHVRKTVELTMLQGKVFPHLLRQAFKTQGVEW